MPSTHTLSLGFGFQFTDLYDHGALSRLDTVFVRELPADLADRLTQARQKNDLDVKSEAALLIELSPYLDNFLAQLFGIDKAVKILSENHVTPQVIFDIRRLFVQRKANTAFKVEELSNFDGPALEQQLSRYIGGAVTELSFAKLVEEALGDEANHAVILDTALRYAAWALHTPSGRAKHGVGVLFQIPKKTNTDQLIHGMTHTSMHETQVIHFDVSKTRARKGFSLTDQGMDLSHALGEAHYCIGCHAQGKDSCSKGLREKPTSDGTVSFKKSVFGVTLAGCPLEERISEFLIVKAQGHPLSALAMITIDNPMAAATGHRICNDCMKSCIYQKQQPVDIPQAETRVLKDVLNLPWGFEIYSLLTRWNPLNLQRWLPRASTGYNVLVVGMGPAGYTLAHHLLNEGHKVVAIDALKIEPLASELNGVGVNNERVSFAPVHCFDDIKDDLDELIPGGFGGVSEYGITVRWDKNFLKVVRLLLQRRTQFSLFGGVRFGGTITLDQAFDLGFDHIALAMGAGKPTLLDIPNAMARGVRAASDFLMGLQLSGAADQRSIANLQLRLPAVVVGGGLTAIDTATEALAYYPVQVEKFARRYRALVVEHGAEKARALWSEEDAQIADEFLAHALEIESLRLQTAAGQTPNFIPLLQKWGGVTVVYRKGLNNAPAYTLNHEEIEKALEEGIYFAPNLSSTHISIDEFQAVNAITFERTDKENAISSPVTFPARAVFIAAGTQPNTVLAREDKAHFQLAGKYFATIDWDGQTVSPEYAMCKPKTPQMLVHKTADERFVSFFGDLHPSYFGNVVKAMGAAKQGYPTVTKALQRRAPSLKNTPNQKNIDLGAVLAPQLTARIHAVNRLTPQIVEIVFEAPMAARAFLPGQFYRAQNYANWAVQTHIAKLPTTLATEALALTGAWVDKEKGLVACIALEMGGSSNLCADFVIGQSVVLMGPTGEPTHINARETVILIGGGLGNAVLFSIGKAFRAAGSKVLYFAGYKKLADRYKIADIEAAADVIVWCCDEAPGFQATRVQDKTFVGNMVMAMQAYGRGDLGQSAIAMSEAQRLIVIGSDRMMAAVARARHEVLKPLLNPNHVAIGSINSPMQCMMKEVCAQCIQAQIDPVSGKVSYVFTCAQQDQELDLVDFEHLATRLLQNSVQEKVTAQFLQLAHE